ncbi:hypothetical protein WA026_015593 [Henosepilachna vigintioctopunctata]|uniref:Endonuclease/exonuclease/phosphatase domain-containing protein n=1 Tax=Henosepilachna vigintioctopunctata TaxID=420089 RepID=A0AAW1VD52_9CUCU
MARGSHSKSVFYEASAPAEDNVTNLVTFNKCKFNSRSFLLMHLNIQGVNNKLNQLECFLEKSGKPDFLCITESWMDSTKCGNFNLDGWTLASFYGRTHRNRGGVVVLCRNNIKFINLTDIISLSKEVDCEVAGIHICDENLTIVSIYHSPSGSFDSFLLILEEILNSIDSSVNLIVCGDFNVHFNIRDQEESYHKIKDKSKIICDLFRSFGLHRTIFHATRGDNCLDNIFTNFQAGEAETRVIGCDFSDHKAQTFRVALSHVADKVIPTKCRPLTEQGYSAMHGMLQILDWGCVIRQNGDINNNFRIFQQNFVDCFLMAFPERVIRGRQGDGGIRWFTRELDTMRKKLTLVNELYILYRYDNLKSLRNRLRLEYRLALRRARVEANDKIIKSSTNVSKTAWNLINKKRRFEKLTDELKISPNEFNDHFASIPHALVGSLPRCSGADGLFSRHVPSSLSFEFGKVSQVRVREVVSSLRNSKSKDFYGLCVPLLKRNVNSIIYPLTTLINQCLESGVFPDCLKVSKTIPLYKKGDPGNVGNYRPISLLPVFSKVLEKIMCHQVIEFLS